MSVLVITLVMVMVGGEVEGQSADLLASVIEFSDYPEEDSDLMKRLDNGVPVNVIQRPDTGLNVTKHQEYKAQYKSQLKPQYLTYSSGRN